MGHFSLIGSDRGLGYRYLVPGRSCLPSIAMAEETIPRENASSTCAIRSYNYRQTRARMPIENAFGRLKGRWRCLLKRMDHQLENMPNVVAACVVLHV